MPLTASATDLYNGSLNTSPESQGWLTYGPDASNYTPGASFTNFDTTSSNTLKDGYSNLGAANTLPILDRNFGFDVTLNMKMLSEAHASGDRAGVSLIVLDKDHKGVELGFWADQVWAQQDSPLQTHPGTPTTEATSAFNPSDHEWVYDLHIGPAGYTLTADGTQILSGPNKDYSAFAGFPNVYALPDFIFLGDDTTSANGHATFSELGVTVPEPASLSLAAILGSLAIAHRKRRAH